MSCTKLASTLLMMVVGLLLGLLSQSARWGMIGWEMFFLSLLFPVLYSLLIWADSTGENHSLRVGMLSVLASFVQLIGYGTGFLRHELLTGAVLNGLPVDAEFLGHRMMLID